MIFLEQKVTEIINLLHSQKIKIYQFSYLLIEKEPCLKHKFILDFPDGRFWTRASVRLGVERATSSGESSA